MGLIGLATGFGLLLGRPLAGISLSAPDRDDPRWYRGRPVSRRRWAAVTATAIAFGVAAALAAGWTTLLPAWLALSAVLTPLAVIDVERHRLPNRLVFTGYGLAAALLGLAAIIDQDDSRPVRAGIAAAVVFAGFTAAAVAGGLGFGDAKLAALLAAYLGWLGWASVLAGLFGGFLIGAAGAVVLLATRRAGWRSGIAFGPSLMLGTLIAGALA